MDFNVLRSPTGWWFEHLVETIMDWCICPFGRVAIFGLIAILTMRHYVKITIVCKHNVIYCLYFITNEYGH